MDLFTSRMKCVNHTYAPESINNERQDKRKPQISDSPKKILEANVSQSCIDNPPNSYSIVVDISRENEPEKLSYISKHASQFR